MRRRAPGKQHGHGVVGARKRCVERSVGSSPVGNHVSQPSAALPLEARVAKDDRAGPRRNRSVILPGGGAPTERPRARGPRPHRRGRAARRPTGSPATSRPSGAPRPGATAVERRLLRAASSRPSTAPRRRRRGGPPRPPGWPRVRRAGPRRGRRRRHPSLGGGRPGRRNPPVDGWRPAGCESAPRLPRRAR